MDGSVTHMFYNEFIYYIFSTNSYAFSLRLSCMCMARNYNNLLLNGSFFVCIGFYKILIKLLLLYLLLLFNLHDGLVIVGYKCRYNCK